MFDFATSEVGTKIFCASPSEDSHEVDLLISRNKYHINNFFLASHFVKPPCDVVISLPFAINLQSVGVAPRATSLCSDVISIFVSEKGWEEISQHRDPHSFYKYCGTFEDLSNQGANFVYMENVMYKVNPKFPVLSSATRSGVKFVKNMYSMHNVKSVKLRINRVAKSGPPCLKGVEVWGQPNAHNDPTTLSSFFNLVTKSVHSQAHVNKTTDIEGSNIFKPISLFDAPPSLPHKPGSLLKQQKQINETSKQPNTYLIPTVTPTNTIHITTNTNSKISTNSQILSKSKNSTNSTNSTNPTNIPNMATNSILATNSINTTNSTNATNNKERASGYDIPSHFMDPITCEVMREPVVLPSGHRVDKSTITRHLATNTTDPFSRQQMEMSDVLPDKELQQNIENVLQSRKRKSDAMFSSFPGKGQKLGRLNDSADAPVVHPLVSRFNPHAN